VKPVYVSAGHLIDLPSAVDLTLRLAPRYRLPETTRLADRLSRSALRKSLKYSCLMGGTGTIGSGGTPCTGQ
jgi:hypothetical protein